MSSKRHAALQIRSHVRSLVKLGNHDSSRAERQLCQPLPIHTLPYGSTLLVTAARREHRALRETGLFTGLRANLADRAKFVQ